MNFILAKLKEASTWRGLIILASVCGISFSPEKTEAIVGLAVALIGVLEVWRKETVPGGPFNPHAPVRKATAARKK